MSEAFGQPDLGSAEPELKRPCPDRPLNFLSGFLIYLRQSPTGRAGQGQEHLQGISPGRSQQGRQPAARAAQD